MKLSELEDYEKLQNALDRLENKFDAHFNQLQSQLNQLERRFNLIWVAIGATIIQILTVFWKP